MHLEYEESITDLAACVYKRNTACPSKIEDLDDQQQQQCQRCHECCNNSTDSNSQLSSSDEMYLNYLDQLRLSEDVLSHHGDQDEDDSMKSQDESQSGESDDDIDSHYQSLDETIRTFTLPQLNPKTPEAQLKDSQKLFDFSDEKVTERDTNVIQQTNYLSQIRTTRAESSSSNIPKNHTIQVSDKLIEMMSKESREPDQATDSSDQARSSERLTRYLGLVIERDEEYEIEEDDLMVLLYRQENGIIDSYSAKELEEYKSGVIDLVERQYVPNRGNYVNIVRKSHNLIKDLCRKRGRTHFMQSCLNLRNVAKQLKNQKFKEDLQKMIDQAFKNRDRKKRSQISQ